MFLHLSSVFAANVLVVDEELKVYRKRSTGSRVLAVLDSGDVAKLLKTKSKKYYRVQFRTEDGETRRGYIHRRAVELSQIQNEKDFNYESGLRNKQEGTHRFGVLAVGNLSFQSPREVSTVGGATYNVELSYGFQFFPELFYQFPLTQTWNLRFHYGMRSILLRQSFTNSESPGSLQKTVSELLQKFNSMGIEVMSLTSRRNYVGMGLEIAKGTSSEMKVIEGVEVNQGVLDVPTFWLAYASYRVPLVNTWGQLHLDFRGGTVVNTTPFIFFADVAFGLSF